MHTMSIPMRTKMESFLAVVAFASLSLASGQAALGGNSVAAAQITGRPAVVEYYNREFNNIHLANEMRVQNMGGWCSGCDQSPECCPLGGWSISAQPATTSAPSTIVTKIQPCECDTSSTPTPPNPTSWAKLSLPTTVLSASPAWETLLRRPSRNPPLARAPAAPAAAAIPQPAQPVNQPQLNPLHDVTNTYYTFTIEGHHPFTLPLILQTGTQTPITLLAPATLTHHPSFISTTLLTHLNLTTKIHPSPPHPTHLFTTPISITGTITLDILTGKNDRFFPSTPFLVFTPTSAPQPHGPLRPDVVVGTGFLGRAGALQLTSEYAGVGAKEGLGIVVQRVYESRGPLQGSEEEQEEEWGEL